MLNRIVITGRIVSSPELKQTANDIAVTTIRIANDRNYKNQENHYDTDFFDVEAWRKNAEFICRHFTKGQLITVEGELRTDTYQDKNGDKRCKIKIIADRAFFGGDKRADASDSVKSQDFEPDFSPSNESDLPQFPF